MFDLFSNMDFVWYTRRSFNRLIWVCGVLPFTVGFLLSGYFGGGVRVQVRVYNRVTNLLSKLTNRRLRLSNLGFCSLVFFLAILNLWGLFPGLFGLTCQISFVLFISLQVWLAINLSSARNSFSSFIGHLTPEGSPIVLAPLLSVIELVSLLIRPLTLTLRLCINMTTGHILLNLLNLSLVGSLMSCNWVAVIVLMLVGFYCLFEVGICVIQAGVFSLLVRQYTDDHTV